MNERLRQSLLKLAERDDECRARLAASGALFDGYNAEMAAVHASNAEALSTIIEQHGWPGIPIAGEDGAAAAWLVLQHAICYPDLQRRSLPLLQEIADRGDIPAWHVAMLHDRIRCFEGRLQRYGTQFDWDDDGELSPLPLENPERVDEWRREVDLEPLAERKQSIREAARLEGQRPPDDLERHRQEKANWARSVGWKMT